MRLPLILFITATLAAAEPVAEPGFTPLFDGKSLAGWWGCSTEDPLKWHALSAEALARKRADSLDALPADVAERRVNDALAGDEVVPDPDRVSRRAAVEAALATLPALDRTIVEMRLRDDLSTEEVSTRTGLTVSAVKTRLHRARARLQNSALVDVFAA